MTGGGGPTLRFLPRTVQQLTLSMPGSQQLAQAGGGESASPLNSASLYSNYTKFGVEKYNHMTSL